jgi:hypothetical protein
MGLRQRVDKLERQTGPTGPAGLEKGGLYLFHDNGDGTCMVGNTTMTIEEYHRWLERMGDRVARLTLDLFDEEGTDDEPQAKD